MGGVSQNWVSGLAFGFRVLGTPRIRPVIYWVLHWGPVVW